MARDWNEPAPAQAEISGNLKSNSVAKGLREVTRLLERPDLLDGHWPQLAGQIAALLNAENCWIVLSGSGNDGGKAVRAYGNNGAILMQKSVRDGSEFHRMLARASAMLMPQPDAPPPQHDYDAGNNTIFMPICVDDMVVGVVNVRGEKKNLPFNEMHFETSRIVALLIGKTLHLGRLQKVLNSRFAQLALMQNPAPRANTLRQALRQPKTTVSLMAKSFYREMEKAGFTAPEIIAAASEIISELANSSKSRGKEP